MKISHSFGTIKTKLIVTEINPSHSDWMVRFNKLDGTVNDIEPINEAK